jgi:hypothetical protein
VKNGRFQAKDIDDVFFLGCVYGCSMSPDPPLPWAGNAKPDYYPLDRIPHWVFTWHLECLMPIFPSEVILAKASALIRRGLLTGCDCGCRGDFELTRAGAQLVLDTTGELFSITKWQVVDRITVTVREVALH